MFDVAYNSYCFA